MFLKYIEINKEEFCNIPETFLSMIKLTDENIHELVKYKEYYKTVMCGEIKITSFIFPVNYIGGDVNHPLHVSLKPMYTHTDNFSLFQPTIPHSASNSDTYLPSNSESNKLSLLLYSSDFGPIGNNKHNKIVRSDYIRFKEPIYKTASFDALSAPKHRTYKSRPRSLLVNLVDY